MGAIAFQTFSANMHRAGLRRLCHYDLNEIEYRDWG